MSLQVLTAKEAAQKILKKNHLFILDVRNEEDYNDWKIEGENVTTVNVPYFELIDGVDQIIDRIPADQEVLVVCAKVGSSQFVAEQLIEKLNRTIYYLEGGMKTWSEHLEPVKLGDLANGGAIYQFVRIGKGCLSYFVESDGEAAIIDATRMIDTYEQFAKERGVQIKHVFDTHLHADHISGGRKLTEKSGGTYWLPPKDAEEVVYDYAHLEGGQTISVGKTELNIQALYSPGHTIGSTSLIVDNQYLITGDILFIDSIGRPDLAGKAGDWVLDLRNTLYDLYTKLDPNLYVLPAHYAKLHEQDEEGRVFARLGDLYENNTGLNIQDEEKFRQTVTENLPPQPNSYQEIRQTNMGKITPKEEEQTEMEIGPNRCAVS